MDIHGQLRLVQDNDTGELRLDSFTEPTSQWMGFTAFSVNNFLFGKDMYFTGNINQSRNIGIGENLIFGSNQDSNILIGRDINVPANRSNQIVIGQNSGLVEGDYNISIGHDVQPGLGITGSNTIAIGQFIQIGGEASIGMGQEAFAKGTFSISLGYRSNTASTYDTAIGVLAKTNVGGQGTAIGAESIAGQKAIALGASAQATVINTIALGSFSRATGTGSMILSGVGGVTINSVPYTLTVHTKDPTPDFGARAGAIELRQYAKDALPSPVNSRVDFSGVIVVTDDIGGRTLATSDNTNWRRVSDGAIIA